MLFLVLQTQELVTTRLTHTAQQAGKCQHMKYQLLEPISSDLQYLTLTTLPFLQS